MKVVHLQISRVISTDAENMPIFETYPIKLGDENGDYERFIANVAVMGYVKKNTKVLKVVEIDDKTRDVKGEVNDISSYENKLAAMFVKKADVSVDYKAELDKANAKNEDLLKRLEAMEKYVAQKQKEENDAVEMEVLTEQYRKDFGKEPDKRWSLDRLKKEFDKK